jgi:hypothetical protein
VKYVALVVVVMTAVVILGLAYIGKIPFSEKLRNEASAESVATTEQALAEKRP